MPIAINKFGAHFSSGPVPNYSSLPNFAHVYIDTIFSETANWITFSSSFIPDAEYSRICLGVFYEDDSITIVDNDTYLNSTAYFLVDAVHVGNDDIPVANIGNLPNVDVLIPPNPATG